MIPENRGWFNRYVEFVDKSEQNKNQAPTSSSGSLKKSKSHSTVTHIRSYSAIALFFINLFSRKTKQTQVIPYNYNRPNPKTGKLEPVSYLLDAKHIRVLRSSVEPPSDPAKSDPPKPADSAKKDLPISKEEIETLTTWFATYTKTDLVATASLNTSGQAFALLNSPSGAPQPTPPPPAATPPPAAAPPAVAAANGVSSPAPKHVIETQKHLQSIQAKLAARGLPDQLTPLKVTLDNGKSYLIWTQEVRVSKIPTLNITLFTDSFNPYQDDPNKLSFSGIDPNSKLTLFQNKKEVTEPEIESTLEKFLSELEEIKIEMPNAEFDLFSTKFINKKRGDGGDSYRDFIGQIRQKELKLDPEKMESLRTNLEVVLEFVAKAPNIEELSQRIKRLENSLELANNEAIEEKITAWAKEIRPELFNKLNTNLMKLFTNKQSTKAFIYSCMLDDKLSADHPIFYDPTSPTHQTPLAMAFMEHRKQTIPDFFREQYLAKKAKEWKANAPDQKKGKKGNYQANVALLVDLIKNQSVSFLDLYRFLNERKIPLNIGQAKGFMNNPAVIQAFKDHRGMDPEAFYRKFKLEDYNEKWHRNISKGKNEATAEANAQLLRELIEDTELIKNDHLLQFFKIIGVRFGEGKWFDAAQTYKLREILESTRPSVYEQLLEIEKTEQLAAAGQIKKQHLAPVDPIRDLVTINCHGGFSHSKFELPPNVFLLIPHPNGLDQSYVLNSGKTSFESMIYGRNDGQLPLPTSGGFQLCEPGSVVNDLFLTPWSGAHDTQVEYEAWAKRGAKSAPQDADAFKGKPIPAFATVPARNGKGEQFKYKGQNKEKVKVFGATTLQAVIEERVRNTPPGQPIVIIPFTCNAKSNASNVTISCNPQLGFDISPLFAPFVQAAAAQPQQPPPPPPAAATKPPSPAPAVSAGAGSPAAKQAAAAAAPPPAGGKGSVSPKDVEDEFRRLYPAAAVSDLPTRLEDSADIFQLISEAYDRSTWQQPLALLKLSLQSQAYETLTTMKNTLIILNSDPRFNNTHVGQNGPTARKYILEQLNGRFAAQIEAIISCMTDKSETKEEFCNQLLACLAKQDEKGLTLLARKAWVSIRSEEDLPDELKIEAAAPPPGAPFVPADPAQAAAASASPLQQPPPPPPAAAAAPPPAAQLPTLQTAQAEAATIHATTEEFYDLGEVVKNFKVNLTQGKTEAELRQIYEKQQDKIAALKEALEDQVTPKEIILQGQDSINRGFLTAYAHYFQNQEFIEALFAAEALIKMREIDENILKVCNGIHGGSLKITDLITFGLSGNSPEALESLPINRVVSWKMKDQHLLLPNFTKEEQSAALNEYLNRKRNWKNLVSFIKLLGGNPQPAASPYHQSKWKQYRLADTVLEKLEGKDERTVLAAGLFTPDEMKEQARQGLMDLCLAMGVPLPNIQKEAATYTSALFHTPLSQKKFTIGTTLDNLVDQITKTPALLIPGISHGLDRVHLLAALLDKEKSITLQSEQGPVEYSMHDIYMAVFRKLEDSPTHDRAIAAEQFYIRLKMAIKGLDKKEGPADGAAPASQPVHAPPMPVVAPTPIEEKINDIYGDKDDDDAVLLKNFLKENPNPQLQKAIEIVSRLQASTAAKYLKPIIQSINEKKDITDQVNLIFKIFNQNPSPPDQA